MTECCSVGALAKLAINDVRMDFIDFQPIRIVRPLSDASERSIRGRLDRSSTAVASGILYVDYRVGMYMTKLKMDTLLPIMGLVESPDNTFTLGNALAGVDVVLGPSGSPEVTFGDSFVNRWLVRGVRGGDPVRIDIWFRAKTRTENAAGTYFVSDTNPALVEGYPYQLTQGSMNLHAATRYFHQFAIGLDYRLDAEWNNSVTATNICPTDHDISVGTGVLYSTCAGTDDLVTDPFSGDVDGDSFTLTFSRSGGGQTLTTEFSIGNVKLIPQQPGITSKNLLIRAALSGKGYAVGTAPSLIVTNSAV